MTVIIRKRLYGVPKIMSILLSKMSLGLIYLIKTMLTDEPRPGCPGTTLPWLFKAVQLGMQPAILFRGNVFDRELRLKVLKVFLIVVHIIVLYVTYNMSLAHFMHAHTVMPKVSQNSSIGIISDSPSMICTCLLKNFQIYNVNIILIIPMLYNH